MALWPVFEDQHEHGLIDEGAVLLDAGEELDAIATSAGHAPLSTFDAYADVPEQVVVLRTADADGMPDLSDFPVTWHDPATAAATLDTLIAAVRSGDWPGEHERELILHCLAALRDVLTAAAARGTRFHLTIA